MVDWLFRRHFWIVHLVFLALCASILALTVNTWIGYKIAKAVLDQPDPVVNYQSTNIEYRSVDFSKINERNLFDAKRETVERISDSVGVLAESGRWQDAVKSNARLRLVSTAVFLDPRNSLATIQDLSSSLQAAAMSYSINDCVSDDRNIDPILVQILGPSVLQPLAPCNKLGDYGLIRRIEEWRVYFYSEKEKRFEYLAMSDEMAPPLVIPPSTFNDKAPNSGEYGHSVRKTGKNSYEIDSADLDSALDNLAEISTQARAIPAFKDGKSIGFRLINIKPDSVFEKIGLQNGNVITQINGYDLNDPAKALELYQKLKTNEQFSIKTEDGRELSYSILGRR